MSTLTENSVATLAYRDAVAAAMFDEMAEDEAVLFMGEDVAVAGGIHKTNTGLLEQFGPERVRNTPICENTFVGVALGMAVTGLRPIVEIMFADFLPTAADAIVNELAKFRFMTGGQCSVPVTIRAIGGATRRLGTQHSATGESWFMQFPGLRVATASSPGAAYSVLRAAIRSNDPVLFFEHKGLYAKDGPVTRGRVAEVGRAQVLREGADVTVLATLLMADRARSAAEELAPRGVSVEVIDPTWLRPLDLATIERSVAKTGRLVVVEEQVHSGGWGASVVSKLAQRGSAPSRLTSIGLDEELLLPASPPLEDEMIPSVARIAAGIEEIVA